jgi:hypothetical protein
MKDCEAGFPPRSWRTPVSFETGKTICDFFKRQFCLFFGWIPGQARNDKMAETWNLTADYYPPPNRAALTLALFGAPSKG